MVFTSKTLYTVTIIFSSRLFDFIVIDDSKDNDYFFFLVWARGRTMSYHGFYQKTMSDHWHLDFIYLKSIDFFWEYKVWTW